MNSLRTDAISIWQAGVDAVDSEALVGNAIVSNESWLTIGGHQIDLNANGKLVVVGAGKAGAGMAAGFEAAVGRQWLDRLCGWVNVPADCVRPLERIHLHAARPAGVNEPTSEGVAGAERILDLVSELTEDDVCVVLLSGGGSALLPAPVEGISLEDKQAVTRYLMHAGASIGELNCVRKQLSRIKGGRLAAATHAGVVITLIISDVIGDPLDVVASGPTVADTTTAADALDVLKRFAPNANELPTAVFDVLRDTAEPTVPTRKVHHHVIGNNATALEAAKRRATELGYRVNSLGSDNAGEAKEVGRELAEICIDARDRGTPSQPPVCFLSGGEPVVELAQTEQPRKGGRNQEVVLAATQRLRGDGARRIAILSGGTDGEDGPTDAAGAVTDEQLIEFVKQSGVEPIEYLAINNSYPFFQRTGGLIQTGPTHTNVMDLRVCLVR